MLILGTKNKMIGVIAGFLWYYFDLVDGRSLVSVSNRDQID